MGAARAAGGDDADFAAHDGRQFAHDRQPDTAAMPLHRSSALSLNEGREDAFGIFGRKSRLIADAGAAPTNPFARNGFQARK